MPSFSIGSGKQKIIVKLDLGEIGLCLDPALSKPSPHHMYTHTKETKGFVETFTLWLSYHRPQHTDNLIFIMNTREILLPVLYP